MLELPLTDLEQRVRDELYENVALEEGKDPEQQDNGENADFSDGTDESIGENTSGEGVQDDDFIGLDEELPVYTGKTVVSPDAEVPIGDTRSFIDDLEAQIADYDVTDHQRQLISYLIGSLDDRGFVERPLRNIADDLLFNHNVETDEHELEAALHVLQQFDPPGIGARSLQECLLIQLDRQQLLSAARQSDKNTLALWQLERKIIADHFGLFSRNDMARLAEALQVGNDQLRQAIHAISRLNPHPGRSLHEAADDRAQTIVPDFVVETDHESTVSFTLNAGEVPPLRVSEDYLRQLKHYQQSAKTMSRSQHEAFLYTKQKVESAQMFISAIQQRQHTLVSTMQAIISFQRTFLLSQDEADLQPLRLNDVALRTGLNISTISRVINSKYALVDGTVYPLKYFFLRTKSNADGKEIAKTKIYPLLRDIVDNEDKNNPLSDEQISVLMRERGEAISRRTVAKYRDELNIPVAALRKKV